MHVVHGHVDDDLVGAFVDDNRTWFWPVVGVVSLVVLLLVVRWLIAVLFSTDRSGDVVLPGDRAHGTTTLAAGALTAATEREIESFTGVQSAAARLIGDPTAPELVVDVTLNRDADPTAVRRRIEDETIGHVRQAMDQPNLPATVDISIGNRTIDKVR
ncbi:hypothetical protein JL107_14150 [Nakamurella flavida]|uniref:Alkaline shock response membrane anchor protein AmaP n=1 Tax=Nakamurella flavida TaxID=363630 RepID=A0A938YQK6_9ACTN|nr:hypothetical protein [Nakamurella flavida]MBM9477589.1 hypothetical protein [Nakamurella flavida]MDP9779137.1 hypothetical protein [Nakamurella flavida]